MCFGFVNKRTVVEMKLHEILENVFLNGYMTNKQDKWKELAPLCKKNVTKPKQDIIALFKGCVPEKKKKLYLVEFDDHDPILIDEYENIPEFSSGSVTEVSLAHNAVIDTINANITKLQKE